MRSATTEAVTDATTAPAAEPDAWGLSEQIETALQAIRSLLGMLAAFTVLGYRPMTAQGSFLSTIVVVATIGVSAAALNLLSRQVKRAIGRSSLWAGFSQAADVAAVVALACALDGPLNGQAWVLIVIPIVSGSVRLGSRTAFLSWAGGIALLALAGWFGFTANGLTFDGLLRSAGVLLAVAATISILARWMRDAWEAQSTLTAVVARREARLAVIERAARAMARVPASDALRMSADLVVSLGFEAATIRPIDSELFVHRSGADHLIPASATDAVAPPAEVQIARWTSGRETVIHSASVQEVRSGHVITGWSSVPILEDAAAALAILVGQVSMVIETSTTLAALRVEAQEDPLTGLANRRGFESFLTKSLRDDETAVLAFIDLDNFKVLNDTHGHEFGDQILRSVAGRLRNGCLSRDRIARLGGDEFVVLVPNGDVLDAARLRATLEAAMSNPISVRGVTTPVTWSAGIAARRTPISERALLEAADRKLYEAKSSGRGRVASDILIGGSAVALRAQPALSGITPVRRDLLGSAMLEWSSPVWSTPSTDPSVPGASPAI